MRRSRFRSLRSKLLALLTVLLIASPRLAEAQESTRLRIDEALGEPTIREGRVYMWQGEVAQLGGVVLRLERRGDSLTGFCYPHTSRILYSLAGKYKGVHNPAYMQDSTLLIAREEGHHGPVFMLTGAFEYAFERHIVGTEIDTAVVPITDSLRGSFELSFAGRVERRGPPRDNRVESFGFVTSAIDTSADLQIATKPRTIGSKRDGYRINMDRPILSKRMGKRNPFAKFNRDVAVYMGAVGRDWQGELEGERNTYQDFNIGIAALTPRIVSLNLSGFGYWGGAHGGMQGLVYNYDVVKGKRIDLEDLFLDTVDLWRMLLPLANEALAAQSDYGEAELDSNDYRFWTLTRTGIDFYLPQPFSYADGDHSVSVPYGRLRHLLRPDGVWQHLWQPEPGWPKTEVVRP